MKQKDSNPLIWGAWAGIVGGIIAAIANAYGELNDGGTVWGYAMGAFFWVYMVANVKNWLANRPLR